MAVTSRGLKRRKAVGIGFRIGTYLALLLVLGPAIWILGGVVARAVPHWRWDVLWTPTKGSSGGLEGAIIGTLILMLGVLIIAGSVDVLAGIPSIVLGYVGYVALVVGLHWGYSLLPALLILSIMVVPYIAKATETAIRQVPTAYREDAEALGMSIGYGLRKVVLKSALPGIVTGLLIALAIACGETAPLLYTAGWSGSVWTGSFIGGHQFSYLTYPVYVFYNTADPSAHSLSYDAALLLLVIVLILLVSSRIIVARTQRHAEGH